jgi:heptaprenyl diphosphate synthase
MTNKSNLAPIYESESFTERFEYSEAIRLTEMKIRKLLRTAPLLVRRQMSHLAEATGKGIRAQALLACAMGSDGLVGHDAINAAVAVEMLHLATLIHDDIIDNADIRRGITALHMKFGEKTAVLCGDYLFCLAFDLVSSIPSKEKGRDEMGRILPSYFTEICLGEIRELSNTGNFNLTEREYFKIISGKTAALFQASFHAGFLLSDDSPETIDIYIEIGKQLGMLFQLVDDCLDFLFSKKEAKKPVLTDCRQGVVTLPLIYALKVDKSLRGKIENGLSEQELKAAVIEAGGIEYTKSKIKECRVKAKKLISSLGPENKKSKLELLLDKAAAL